MKSFYKSLNIDRSSYSQRHVITERDCHCDAWTQQSNHPCVTKRIPLSLLTVYRRIYGQ